MPRWRPKNKTLEQLLKERLNGSWEKAVEAQRPKKLPDNDAGEFKTSEEKRRKNREAVRRYHATEKGRENNRKSCRKYYHTHPEKAKAYVSRYKEKFFEKWGVNMNSWLYWQAKLNNGTVCTPDIPERFAGLVEQWKIKKARQ